LDKKLRDEVLMEKENERKRERECGVDFEGE